MFDTPYQTTPCSRFAMEKTTAGIRKLEINEQLVSPEETPIGVKFVPPGVIDFPPFLQPMTRKEIQSLEADVVIDGRSILRADGSRNKLDVFRHATLTAELTKMWAYGDISTRRDMLNVSDFPARVFITWVTSAISLRLGLDFGQVSILRGLVAVYYIQLHNPLTEHSTQDERDRILIRASRLVTGVDPATFGRIVGDLVPLNTIGEFVEWVKKVIDSPRIEQLTVTYIYTSLGFSWGPAYREAVAVALEYPPIFLALTYTSTIERSYSKTGLGKVVERVAFKGSDKDFIKNMNHLIGQRV